MSATPQAPLSQGVGYGAIIGFGAFFALAVVGISQALRRYADLKQSSSEYAVASRSLGIGLTSAGAVSAWTWSVTLLSSCSTAYNYGVAGAVWYGGANIQIALFSAMSIRLKEKGAHFHTHLELLRSRFGVPSHLTFTFFSIATNILVCSAVLVGAASTVNSLTGVSVYASLFLLPLAVAAYTLSSGLRGTILADYLHTLFIFAIIFALWISTYAVSDEIGSPAKMFELLSNAGAKNPSGNFEGSFLTLRSVGAIKFGWLSFLEYLGVVFGDPGYHLKGIAARPGATVPGYVGASLAWFSIPWCLATTAGLAALALETVSPAFPTYPNRMSASEVSAGLVLPYAAQAILGRGGAVAVLILIFMSSTSSISAQLIAVSSVGGYDIYKGYIKKDATSDQILRVQQYVLAGFSLFIAAFASLLHGVGVDLGFLYNITGIWSTAALVQLIFSFFVASLPAYACFPGIWIGFGTALGVWLGLAKRLGGEVNLTTLGTVDVNLYAFVAAIATGLVICTFASIFTPSSFKFEDLKNDSYKDGLDEQAKQELEAIETDVTYSKENLRRWLWIALGSSLLIFAIFMLVWPLSLYRKYIFTETFFEGWSVVSLIWSFAAFGLVGIFPLYEGLPLIRTILHGIRGKETSAEQRHAAHLVNPTVPDTAESITKDQEAGLDGPDSPVSLRNDPLANSGASSLAK